MKRALLPALFAFLPSLAFANAPVSGHVVALDPGHGVIDFQGNIINSGKTSSNGKNPEYALTFSIAQKIGKLIEEAGGRVIYTRTREDYWRQSATSTDDNKARAHLANELNADVYISIHCDWHPRSRIAGVTTYYKTDTSHRLGQEVHSKLISTLKAPNRQLKKDSFTVLDQTTMPTILVETGYLSNRNEAKKLANADYQQKIADAILSGLNSYFSN